MTERTVVHATITVERRFLASPARVFAAWADPEARRRWDVPGEDWVVAEFVSEFRVGGREYSHFGPPGAPRYWSEGRYLDIVPGARIVSAGTMHDREAPSSSTLCTIEILPDGAGTKLILTDQSAYLGGRETPADRKEGWGEIVDRLDAYLRNAA
jgi:uncharacterized protein YndB with AHSA1/START domain